MRTSICHISDIHFKIGENAILNKMSQLSNAILQNLHKNDFVLFFITGDIAQSGSENEYLIALDFILYLKEQLFKAKNIRSYFWFVPGNHDCDFSDVDRNKSDKSFKDTILNSKESISLSDLNFYATNLIKKQSNYIEFYDIFKNDLLNNSDFKCNFIYESPFQWQCIVIFNNLEISINGLNTAWMSEIKEKPGILFIPGSEYIKIKKEKQLTFTLYHHPTSWMHPLDKNDFDRHVMKQSDIIYVGHEHNGRNETTKTRETIYNVQYGEVMQDPDNSEKSGFIINFIENNEMDTYVFRWEKNENLYRSDQYPTISLDKMKRNYLSFTNEFDKFLNTIDLQVLHKMKNDLKLKDLFVYPDFHYRDNKVSIDSKIKKEKIFGEQFFDFLYKYKKISFSGEYKCGKTALAKTIALDLIQKGIYPLYIDAVDLNSASDNYFSKFLDNIIIREYGEDSRDAYKQLKLNKTIILIDNLDRLNNSIIIDAFLYYLNKYFDHIISFSNKNYELGIIEKTLSKQNMDFAQCQICELGHAKRKKLIKNWYSLNENGIIVDDEINNKMAIAINTINILKGNGYMPCIPSHILIILQQLDYSQEKNPDRSSYGYLYEFLVTKSIIEMSKNCKYIHQDIVSGILTKLAYTMLVNKLKVISKIELQYLIKQYNLEYDTDANYEIYYDEFCKINLLKCSNDEISFSYNYIHYYYTAKYLSQTLSDKWTIDKISEMSKMLYDEECGDIMIFLCHLSKEVVIINSVLNNALTIFDKYEAFDFEKHKALDITEQSYVNMNFIPEEDIEYRQDELLNIKDKNEDVEFFIEEDNTTPAYV